MFRFVSWRLNLVCSQSLTWCLLAFESSRQSATFNKTSLLSTCCQLFAIKSTTMITMIFNGAFFFGLLILFQFVCLFVFEFTFWFTFNYKTTVAAVKKTHTYSHTQWTVCSVSFGMQLTHLHNLYDVLTNAFM